ncbi:MAG: LacI family DNA-binding transcriptional regulator [Clostridia bacterium]
MSTIKDVARHTGLSLATISKYMNGGNVLACNRILIDEAVAALDYSANFSAQSLKTNRTKTIGVVMPTLSIPFFGTVVSALDKTMRAAGYTCLITCYDFDRELELEKLRVFANNRVDGLVLVPENVMPMELESIIHMRNRDIPMVLLDRSLKDFSCDNVVIDNLNITYEATERLLTDGYRRIAIIVGPLHISTANERLIGYRRVQNDYGITVDDNLIKIGNYDFESGYRLFNEFMDMEEPPTAMIITNYDMTVGTVAAAYERGVNLGTDIGFVGFDAMDLCNVRKPLLPFIEQPTELMGQKAGELLLKRLLGDKEGYPQLIRLKSRFHAPIVR